MRDDLQEEMRKLRNAARRVHRATTLGEYNDAVVAFRALDPEVKTNLKERASHLLIRALVFILGRGYDIAKWNR